MQNRFIRGVWLYGWPPACFVLIQLLYWCWISISFTCLVKSKPVKQEVSRTVTLSPMISVLWIHSIPTCSMLKRYKSWCVFRSGLIFSISGSLAVDEQARTVTLHRAEVFEAPWWLITRSLARTSSHEDTSRDLLGPTRPIPRPGNNTVKLFLP